MLARFKNFHPNIGKHHKLWIFRVLPHTLRCALIRNHTVSSVGLFKNQVLSTPKGFEIMSRQAIQDSRDIVNEILSAKQLQKVVYMFDELSDTLCQAADLAECVRVVHPDQSFKEHAQNCCNMLGTYVEQLNTHIGLHQVLRGVTDDPGYPSLDEVTQNNVESLMHDFEISGIHLSGEKRQRVVALNSQILSLSHEFMTNCCQPIVIPKAECPPLLAKSFSSDDGNVYIDHVPYTSSNSQLRALSYLTYYTVLPQQVELVESLLSLRHRLASLTGYPTFAHRSLKSLMAGSPETVVNFLSKLSEKMLPLAQEEAQAMTSLKHSIHDCPGPDQLKPWDVLYLSKMTEQRLFPQLGTRHMSNYFSLQTCLEGINHLLWSLFGVELRQQPVLPGEVWHETVQKYAFMKQEETLGILYCDFFHRPDKLVSDCQFIIQGGRERQDGSYQMPVVVLSLSFTSELLHQQAVENLFHEMGHALHSVLGRAKYQNVTGTRCAVDFAEIPSNLMEMFLQDSRVLSSFARHYATGDELPAELMSAFQCPNMYPAFTSQMQILYSLMDQRFHGRHPLGRSTVQLFADLHKEFSPMDYIPGTAWFLRFTHICGYAAKYYSYLWSRAVAALLWSKCFKSDPFSRMRGMDYHKEVLAHGGGIKPGKLIENVLDFRPGVDDLVDAYYQNVLEQREKLAKLRC